MFGVTIITSRVNSIVFESHECSGHVRNVLSHSVSSVQRNYIKSCTKIRCTISVAFYHFTARSLCGGGEFIQLQGPLALQLAASEIPAPYHIAFKILLGA